MGIEYALYTVCAGRVRFFSNTLLTTRHTECSWLPALPPRKEVCPEDTVAYLLFSRVHKDVTLEERNVHLGLLLSVS